MAVRPDYEMWREPALTLGGEFQVPTKKAPERTPGPLQFLGIVLTRWKQDSGLGAIVQVGHQRRGRGRASLLQPPVGRRPPLRPKACPVKRNFQFEKRKKDLDKKQKREDKLKRKLERKALGGDATDELAPEASETEPQPSHGDDPAAG